MPVYYFEPIKSYRTTLDSTVVTTFESGSPIVAVTSNIYNKFNQPEKVTFKTSKGNVAINYTTTPLSYTSLPDLPSTQNLQGAALALQNLRIKNILHKPVESISMIKKSGQDTMVTSGIYQVYNSQGDVINNYQLETVAKIPFSQFQKSTFTGGLGNYDVGFDTRYKLKQSAQYYSSGHLKQLTNNRKTLSYIWDQTYDNVLASVENSLHSDIAFSSFENNDTGNWSLSGAIVDSSDSYTGSSSCDLNGGDISKSGLAAGTYFVSYWIKSGIAQANGLAGNTGPTIGGWTFNEHKVTVGVNGTISLTGNGKIDELRLHPIDASMTTYTYRPLVGISSVTNTNSLTSFYEYDNFQRLKYIKDDKSNILKSYDYQFNINSNNVTPTNIYFNKPLSGVRAKNNCPSGYNGSNVTFSVPEGKYSSFISQADADQKAQDDYNTNAQNYANALGSCTIAPVRPTFTLNYSINSTGEFQVAIIDTLTNQSEYYTISGSGSLPGIPGGNCYVTINEVTYTGRYDFYLESLTDHGVYVQFGPISLAEDISLFIMEQ